MTTPVGAEEPDVQPAIHIAPVAPTAQVIKFSNQRPTVGERVVQRVGMELNLHTVIKQAGQVAHDDTTALRRRQEREIEVLEVVEGRARKAQVSYPLARLMSPENTDTAAETAQVVEGNSYLITRANDRLLVTDLDGAIPTQQEYEIVVSTMESFGQANPLAEFLLAREIQVGETLEVPSTLANKMMGFDSLGDVQKFELHLIEVKQINHQQCAVFKANIVALGKPDNPLEVHAQGTIVIELATCRTIEATLTGPISLLSTEQEVEYKATGDLLLAIRSQYTAKK
ncbi:MAG: hypothetical protein SH868_04805 [Bythopirellula sp.]|nr:hypothetical protein [Bythopirellula sp.]